MLSTLTTKSDDVSTGPRFFSSDVVLVGIGLSTAILTALVIAVVALRFHIALHGVSVWGVIPAGAFLCGIVSASGYALGAKVLGRRPGRLAVAGILAGGPIAYLAVFVFEYLLVDVNGIPISTQLSFPSFVDAVIRATTISYRFHPLTPQLGLVGYPLAAFKLLAFFAGSLAVFGSPWLHRVSCARCARYMNEVASVSGYGTPPQLPVQFGYVRQLLTAGNSNAATAVVGGLSRTETAHKITLEVSSCEPCQREYHRLRLLHWQTLARPPWVPVKGFDVSGQVP